MFFSPETQVDNVTMRLSALTVTSCLIFAAYKYNAIHLIYNFDLTNPEIFQNYLDQIFEIRDMSANIRQDVTVNVDNRIVTLSTCVSGEKNMRYLVQGVLLNE